MDHLQVSCDAGDGLCNCVAPQPKHSPSAACVKDPPISFSFTSRLDGFAFTVLRIRYFHSDSAANGRGPAGVGYLACARGVQMRNHHTSRPAKSESHEMPRCNGGSSHRHCLGVGSNASSRTMERIPTTFSRTGWAITCIATARSSKSTGQT
jgi:hypothetical protein